MLCVMKYKSNIKSIDSVINEKAALWVWKCDSGLTIEEQSEFNQWLESNETNKKTFNELNNYWTRADLLLNYKTEFNQANENSDVIFNTKKSRNNSHRLIWISSLFASIAASILLLLSQQHKQVDPLSTKLPTRRETNNDISIKVQVLEDGSIFKLNNDSVADVCFTKDERRVTLIRGEANFIIHKDQKRPFVVIAHDIIVRDIGTAFNLKVDDSTLDVLVTQGRVMVNHLVKPSNSTTINDALFVDAGQHLIMPLVKTDHNIPRINTLSSKQIKQYLAWQSSNLSYNNVPLSFIVQEFNMHNQLKLVISDPSLQTLRVSAIFPTDNTESLVSLLEMYFDIHAKYRGDSEIDLFKSH